MLFEGEAGACGEYIQQLVLFERDGKFDEERVCACWRRMAERVQALRAEVTVTEGGSPGMVFREKMAPVVERQVGVPLENFLEEDRLRGLPRFPLWRVSLVETGDGTALVWTFHHILLDGRSHTRLFKAFWRSYDDGDDTLVADASAQQFLMWLERRDGRGDEAFFRELLEGFHGHAPVTSGACFDPVPVSAVEVIEARETEGLKAAAERLGVSLHTLAQAAWGLVLCRHADTNRVVFGSVRAGRHWDGSAHRDALGCFVATVPFPVDVQDDVSVGDWLEGLRRQQKALRPHEHASPGEIRRWCGLSGPAFQTILMFDHAPLREEITGPGSRWAKRTVTLREKVRDVALTVQAGERMEIALDAPSMTYAPKEIHNLLCHFCAALRGVASAAPGARVGSLSIFAPGEADRIAAWGRTELDVGGAMLHEWVDRLAAERPGAHAIEAEGVRLDYAALARRTRRLAWWLGEHYHVGTGDRVMLFVDREPAMALLLLSVFRLGAVAVPMDPSTPAARIGQCLRDSGALLVVTTSAHRAALPPSGIPVLDYGEILREAEEASGGEMPFAGPSPDDAAVIFYTSGSTGVPKGALLAHRGFANFAGALRGTFELASNTRVAQISSPSFDASLLDVFLAFVPGGTLVFGTWNELQAGRPMANFLRDKRITAAFFTPTLLGTLPPGELPDLKVLFCGGEVCPLTLAEMWAEGRKFFNLYGPTETTIFTLYERVCPPLNGHPALGRNLPNTRTEIREVSSGGLCPIGVPGEIWIGGVAVGPGYLNLPERTARSFVPDPLVPGAAMYRTGDKGRWLPDGRVDFVERMDRQVKVRGVRVELGEIEAALAGCPGVREAAVLVVENEMVGFVAPPMAEDGLRHHLAKRVSFYLIPDRFEMHTNLPRTISGKLDRQTLRRWTGESEPPQVALLPEEDRRRVMVEWNPVSEEKFPPVHEQLRAFAERNPDACAVGWEGGAMTYGELDRRSNQVANLLGTGDAPVVVFVEMDGQTPALLAGVLKAGRAYVPLDPSLPDERISHIIGQSGAEVVISQPALAVRLPGISPLLADPDWKFLRGIADSPPDVGVNGDRLAYIIYTSGSTGRPKGVEVEHHSLANLCAHYRVWLGLDPSDHSSMLASISFDASIADLWPYLACGASVHVPPPGAKNDLGVLVPWLARAGVTRCFAPTALGELLFDVEWPAGTTLRDLLVGGDRLTRYPPVLPFRVINTYGPTECTVDAVWFEVPQTGAADPPPIGRPIMNYSAYVVDSLLRPVALGVAGELLLGGAGVTRGYRNQPGLTAERFLQNPFAAGRVYRTGDQVRYRADGVLEFIGRNDNQIQIRGFRVELGEIETALRGSPGVREAHVRMVGPAHKPVLTAYFSGSGPLDPPDLRTHLAKSLPPYMVPAAFIRMEALPRNAAGKVDKDRLPAPRSIQGGPGDGPEGEAEEALHALACELLGAEDVAMTANFFDVGGDSILLLSLLLRVEKTFGVSISAMSFLQDPCLRSLAGLIVSRPPRHRSCLLPIKAEGNKPPLFCICPASWFRPVARAMDPGRPMFALEVLLLDRAIVDDPGIGRIAHAFVKAVREVQPESPYHIAGYSSNGMAVVEMARIFRSEGDALAPVLLFDVFAPDLLRTGPLTALWWKAVHCFQAPRACLGKLIRRVTARRTRAPVGAGVDGEARQFGDFARRLHLASLEYRPTPVDADFIVVKSALIPDIFPNRPDLGWRGLCRSLRTHELPGDHRTFLENTTALAAVIDEALGATQSQSRCHPPRVC